MWSLKLLISPSPETSSSFHCLISCSFDWIYRFKSSSLTLDCARSNSLILILSLASWLAQEESSIASLTLSISFLSWYPWFHSLEILASRSRTWFLNPRFWSSFELFSTLSLWISCAFYSFITLILAIWSWREATSCSLSTASLLRSSCSCLSRAIALRSWSDLLQASSSIHRLSSLNTAHWWSACLIWSIKV